MEEGLDQVGSTSEKQSHTATTTKTKADNRQTPRPPTDFEMKVYSMAKTIPKGRVTSYGAIASALNSAPRAVGQALRKNPFAPSVPCHRIVTADGSIGGFAGRWGLDEPKIQKKIRMLKQEGVEFDVRGMLVDQSSLLCAEDLLSISHVRV